MELVCRECEFANTAGPLCYSCSSPLQETEVTLDVVVAVPASLRCASCGQLNSLLARECAVCGCSFAQEDSFIQEDVFSGLNAELSRLEEEEEEERHGDESAALRELMQDDAPQQEDEASMVAPDFAAPQPVARGRRQTVMVEYAERMHAALQMPGPDSEGPEAERAPLISQEAVQAFVAGAIGAEGWEPALTINAGDGVQRWAFRGAPTRLKSQTVFPRASAAEVEEIVWPLLNLPRVDALVYECKLLRQLSERECVVQLTAELAGLGRLDLVCGRVRGVLPSGARYVLMQATEREADHVPVSAASDLLRVKVHGFLLMDQPDGGGCCKCVHVAHNEYDATLAAAGALASKASWNVLGKVTALLSGGGAAGSARPPPPAHAPAPAAIRKLTIARIPVTLASERDKVANEILTSEQTYFQSLLILGSFYIGPILHAALSAGNTTVFETFQPIGFAADALVPYNQALLSELECKMRAWDAESTLGDNFHMVGRFQSIYTKYLQAYSDMLPKVALCEKNAAFAAQMRDLKKAGITNQLDLRSYLIMPVQRFPRYELLLRDLLRATPPEHRDAHLLRTALVKVEAVNAAINRAMQEAANRQKLAEISALFVADPGIRERGGSRRLLKEGVLVKQCQSSRANRKFFLFNDLLMYAKIVPGTGLFTSERYLLSEKMPLTRVHLEDRADDEHVDPPVLCSFVIQSGRKAFAVFAESNEDKCDWLLAVSNATAQLMAEEEEAHKHAAQEAKEAPGQSRESAAPLDVPVWQDDTAVAQCPLCAAKFNSILQRKYHCRLCGCVACGPCTEGRVVVAAWGEDQLRVCKPCYGKERKGVSRVQLPPARRNLTGSLSNLMTMSRNSKHK